MDSPPEFMAMTGRQAARRCAAFVRLAGRTGSSCRSPAFLVEHPGVGPILIDTGFHPSVAVDPKQNLGARVGRLYSIDMKPEQAIAAQLREQKGIEPSDVRVAIMTHLHMDHASAISEFTVRDLRARRGRVARVPRAARCAQRLRAQARSQHAVEYREVALRQPARSTRTRTFGRSFDLFGDGSVRLVYTPGHTHGHQSVILRLKDREALVAGDAIYFLRTLDDERRGCVHGRRAQVAALDRARSALPAREPGRADHPGPRPRALGAARPALRVAYAARPAAGHPQPLSSGRGRRPPRARAASRSSARAITTARLGERAEHEVRERLDRLLLDQAGVDHAWRPACTSASPYFASISRHAARPSTEGASMQDDPLDGGVEADVEEGAQPARCCSHGSVSASAASADPLAVTSCSTCSTTAANRSSLVAEVVVQGAAGDARAAHDLLGATRRL